MLLIHNEFEEKQKEEHTMLSDNIKNLRKNKGFTQEELANKCRKAWTCYNRTKLRETQQNQGFALI